MAVVYWYSIVSVVIVATAVVGSVYVLWRRKQTQASDETGTSAAHVVKQMWLYDTLLVIPANSPSDALCYSLQLWTSCWRGLHPAYLLGLRLLSFFVLAFFLSWDIHHWGASIFIYYTEWTYSLTMMYFAVGSVISAYGCCLLHTHKNHTPCLENVQESQRPIGNQGFDRERGDLEFQTHHYLLCPGQDAQRPGFWGYLMQISYQISAGAVILTDIVFWCIIVPFVSNERLGLTLLMGCIHTVNVAFLLLDTSINRLPFPWFRLAYFVLWSSAYVIFQWIVHLCGFTLWPYPFLKLSTPLAPLWYMVLAVFHIACYGMYALIVRVKDFVFSNLFPHSYIGSYRVN